MNNKISWYIQKKNKFLGDNILAICYNADEKETRDCGLTNDNILIFIKSNKLDDVLDEKDIKLENVLKQSFKNKKVFLRIQCECMLGMYGDLHCDCEEQRLRYLDFIRQNEGIFIHMPQEAQGYGIFYKLKELELQVGGHNQKGFFVGKKDRNDAFYEINHKKFTDSRKYYVIKNIFSELGIDNLSFILLTDSERKLKNLTSLGIDAQMYSTYVENNVTTENASEFLIKILDGSFTYDDKKIKELCDLIQNRAYNERTINTFLKIIEEIKNNKDIGLSKENQKLLLKTYDNIICGVEKTYNFVDQNILKVQNKFSCKVDNKIFGITKMIFGKNIFSRIAFESNYLFQDLVNENDVKIRHSTVLDVNEKNSLFLKGQEYLQQTIIEGKSKFVENEITKSKLKSYFENRDYFYKTKIDMITFISENIMDGVNIYIKRLPNFDNHIMDVYGKKEKILKFIEEITKVSNKTMLDIISNVQLEDDKSINYNLSFSDENEAINEEVSIFKLLNK